MKKRGILVMTVLVVMAMLFASCSSNLSESAEGEGGSSAKAVKVGLSLNGIEESTQKTIALKNIISDYKCKIRTTPQWKADKATIVNPYPDTFHDIGAYSDGVSLGYFTPGTWKFEVDIYNVDSTDPQNPVESKVYSGTNNSVYISPAQTSVVVDMDVYSGGGQGEVGQIEVKISVPGVGANTKLFYSIDNAAFATLGDADDKNTIVDQAGNTTQSTDPTDPTATGTNWWYFENVLTNIAPGTHTVSFDYRDNNTSIGGATVALTVRNGDKCGIYGTIEEGKYQIAALTVNIPKFSFTLGGTTPVLPHETATDTITATLPDPLPFPDAANLTSTVTWYVDGAIQKDGQDNPITGTTFGLSRKDAGRFEVVGVATIKNAQSQIIGIGYSSLIVTVSAPANINFKSQVGGLGPNVSQITSAQTLLCTPKEVPQGATVKWYVDGGNPVTGNTYTFTPEGTGNYVIYCKAYDSNTDELLGYGFKPVTVVAP